MSQEPSGFPALKTERLILRETDDSDLEEIFFLRSDPEVNKYLSGVHCENMEGALAHLTLVQEQFAKGMTFNWSICIRGSRKMIGSICLWNISAEKKTAEIGYALHPLHQNAGYMHESMAAVLNFGFGDQHYERIDAYTHRNNVASIKLLLKNGFRWDESRKDDGDPDNRVFVLTRGQWLLNAANDVARD